MCSRSDGAVKEKKQGAPGDAVPIGKDVNNRGGPALETDEVELTRDKIVHLPCIDRLGNLEIRSRSRLGTPPGWLPAMVVSK